MAKKSEGFLPGKKSGKAFKKIGPQRYKSKGATGFNPTNKFQPKGTKGRKATRRTKKS